MNKDILKGQWSQLKGRIRKQWGKLTDDDWTRQGFQPEYGHFSAEEWLGHWAAHDLTHIEQIQRMRTATEQK